MTNSVKLNTSPIAVFAYNRLNSLQKTIGALQQCKEADRSELYVFCDGPREKDIAEVQLVRDFVKNIKGFKKIQFRFSEINKGLAASIIEGVSEVLNSYDTVIVLEDDLISSDNFLNFMNQALETYQNESKVISIAGYTAPIKLPQDYPYDNYFTKRASSWGWATWKDRWQLVDWSVSDYHLFSKDIAAKKEFNKMGSDLSYMLNKQMNNRINSWAIRWCYHQFRKGLYTVYPTVSKISNIGFGDDATHTKGAENRFSTYLDSSENNDFTFKSEIELDPYLIKQFISAFSIPTRVFYKVKNILGI